MAAKRTKFLLEACVILIGVFLLFPSFVFSRNSDYTLSFIQKPLSTYPIIVQKGNTFEIQFKASSSASGFGAVLQTGYFSLPLNIAGVTYNSSAGIWSITAQTPPDAPEELYDLQVSSSAGTDTSLHAVKIVSAFPSNYYFVQLTDTQPYLPDHWTKLADLIDQLNIIQPEYVVLTGNVVEFGTETEWRSILPYFDKLQVPVYFTPGNQDIFWVDCCSRNVYLDRWKKYVGPLEYSFDFGGVHHTMLNISGYEDIKPEVTQCLGTVAITVTACPYSNLDSSQSSWLAQDLQSAGGKLKLVFAHQLEDDPADHHPNLEETMQTYGAKAFIYGHFHQDGYQLKNGIHWVMTTTAQNGNYRLFRVSPTDISGFNYNNSASQSIPAYGNLKISYSPANDGSAQAVTAAITNNLYETFDGVKLRFVMPKIAKPYQASGGVILQTVQGDAKTLVYVKTSVLPASAKQVAVMPLEFNSPIKSETGAKNPVLLVHGYMGSILDDATVYLYWKFEKDRLDADGFKTYTITLDNAAIQDIAKSAQQVANKVQQILAETGAQKVDVVGHSEGGLVNRYYIQKLGGVNFVDDYISISTPHRGTIMSTIGPGEAASQMVVGSSFLRDLNSGDTLPGNISYTSIYSTMDEAVVPQEDAHYEGAVNEVVNLVGHGGIIGFLPLIDIDPVFKPKAELVYTWLKAALTNDIAKGTKPVVINLGEKVTTQPTVTLHLTGINPLLPDVFVPDQMMLSNSCSATDWLALPEGTWETYSPTKIWNLSSGDGFKIIYVKFKDKNGNESPIFTADILLDRQPPAGFVAVNAGATTTKSNSVTLNVLAADNADAYGAFNGLNGLTAFGILDAGVRDMMISNTSDFSGAVWEPFVPVKSWTLTSGEGTKTVYVKLRDGAGNISSAISGSIDVKTSAPSLTITAPSDLTNILTNGASISVSGKVDAGVSLTLNGNAVTVDANGNFTVSATLTEGTNTLNFVATGAGGVTTSIPVTVTKDTTPPSLSVSSPAANALTNQKTITISGTAEKNALIKIGSNSVYADENGKHSIPANLTEGANNVKVTASDAAGNSVDVTLPVTLDSIAPALSVTSPGDGAILTTPNVTLKGTKETSAAVTVNGVSATGAAADTFEKSLTLSQGENIITVEAQDAAGNKTTLQRKVTYSPSGLSLEVTSPLLDFLTSVETMNVTGATNGVQATVNGDPAAITSGAFSKSIAFSQGEKEYTVTVTATDAQNNTATITRKVTLDKTPPALSFTNILDGFLTGNSVLTIKGQTEAGATLTLNNNPVTVNSDGTFEVNVSLAQGLNLLSFAAKDKALNSVTKSLSGQLDTLAPNMLVLSPLQNLMTKNASVDVKGLADAGIKVFVNGIDANAAADGSFTSTVSLKEGKNVIAIRAQDAALNAAEKSITVYLDTTPPNLFDLVTAKDKSSCSLTFKTTESAKTYLEYGESAQSLTSKTAAETASSILHSAMLPSLKEGASYFYRVVMTDDVGNPAKSDIQSCTTTTGYLVSFPKGLVTFSIPLQPKVGNPVQLLGLDASRLTDNLAIWNPLFKKYERYSEKYTNAGYNLLLSSLDAGKGYWMKSAEGFTLVIEGTPKALTQDVSVQMYEGLNMVGIPYTSPISMTALKFSDGTTTKSFMDAYQSGWLESFAWYYPGQDKGFQLVDPTVSGAESTLQPGKGYFIYSYINGSIIYPAQSTAKAKSSSAEANAVVAGFSIKLSATQGENGDTANFVGVNFTQKQKHALADPPSLDNEPFSLYLTDAQGGHYSADMRPFEDMTGGGALSYDVVVDGKQGEPVALSWALNGPKDRFKAQLVDASGKSVDMFSANNFSFTPLEQKTTFKILLSRNSKLMLADNSLLLGAVYNFPNPDRIGNATFRYQYSPSVVRVSIEVFNVAGKKIDQFDDETIDGEKHWLFGDKLAAGIYVYRITAYDAAGNKQSVVRKLVVVR